MQQIITSTINKEPAITVGLIDGVSQVALILNGIYHLEDTLLSEGRYEAHAEWDHIRFMNSEGKEIMRAHTLSLKPATSRHCSFTLEGITIGKGFHWESSQQQHFKGKLSLRICSPGNIAAINSIPLETYLESVVCSEMNPSSPAEFLKTHCVISRSWLLSQLQSRVRGLRTAQHADYNASEIFAWTDREAHLNYDVCADDHCQRYQGAAKVNHAVKQAVQDTRGEVLLFKGEVCDTRFSKCCGGRTENFSTAWGNRDVAYLRSIADSPGTDEIPDIERSALIPLNGEEAAGHFILSRPKAYCNIKDRSILKKILPELDQETHGFFRWKVEISQRELAHILFTKTGLDFGAIREIIPVARGASGRLSKVKICGTLQQRIVGKELEIRRVLSPTHLLSAAFVVEPYGTSNAIPDGFQLWGAGWGHGVGLCQIGAAAMAQMGKSYQEILSHYFKAAGLRKLY